MVLSLVDGQDSIQPRMTPERNVGRSNTIGLRRLLTRITVIQGLFGLWVGGKRNFRTFPASSVFVKWDVDASVISDMCMCMIL